MCVCVCACVPACAYVCRGCCNINKLIKIDTGEWAIVVKSFDLSRSATKPSK